MFLFLAPRRGIVRTQRLIINLETDEVEFERIKKIEE